MLKTKREQGSRIVKKHRLAGLVPLLFSPVINLLAPDRLARLILEEHFSGQVAATTSYTDMA